MDNQKIIELIQAFSKENLTSLSLKDKDFELTLEKENPLTLGNLDLSGLATSLNQNSNVGSLNVTPSIENDSFEVKAPLVGIFYTSPSPGEEAFVKVGDRVAKGDTLCIIEAMKMINEIPAPVSGVVKSIKYLNEDLVEFDSILMEIDEND